MIGEDEADSYDGPLITAPRPAEADYLDGLPVPKRYWAMLSISLTVYVAVVEVIGTNVALPTIARSLGATPAASIWIVNAYQLAVVTTLLPFSALGDIVGYRRVYQAGIATLAIASLFSALSHSLISLAVARFIQGLGVSGVLSVNIALVRTIFPSSMLGRGVGINAMISAVSTFLAPMVATGILSVASWHWFFAVNIPVEIFALVITMFALPNPTGSGRPFEYKSALLSALTFGILLSSASAFGHGVSARTGAIGVAAAICAGVVLVRRELSQPAPLLAVDLLHKPLFALSMATSVFSYTAQMLAYVSLPFYLQNVLGRSQIERGFLFSAWPLGAMAADLIAGYMVERCSSKLLGVFGMATLSVGLLSLVLLPTRAATVSIVWRIALCGVGFGFFQTPNNRDIMSSAPKERSGAANGMLGTSRLTGQTLGAASVALIFHRFSGATNAGSLAVGACFAFGAVILRYVLSRSE
ncbi:MAG: MFS transporter [Acidobacteria bacterium]|nr:MAG: MFS transporter [Acidobacteriota bacterium]